MTTLAKTDQHQARGVFDSHRRLLGFAGVLALLLFGFWAGTGPHWSYIYPLHVDEWIAIGYAQSTLEAGRLNYLGPYGETEISHHPEMGFHLLLAFLKTSTGLSWLGLYRVAPGLLVALLTFLVYAFGRRDGFGWAAALFVPLIPTAVRTLGPSFLVPVSTAMVLIPVTLLLVHRMEAAGRGNSLWLLLVLIGGTLFVHPPTEMVVTALVALYLATLGAEALLTRRFRRAMDLLVAVGIRLLIPVVVLGVWLPSVATKTAERALEGDPGMTPLLGFNAGFFESFGVLALGLFIWGVFAFLWDRRYGLLTYVLPVFTGLIMWFLLIVYPRYLVGPSIVYERGWSYLGLFMAVFAGYGVAHYFRSIGGLARRVGTFMPRFSSTWIHILLVGVGIGTVATALITGLLNEERSGYSGYYYMMDDQMYADFTWLGQHTAQGSKVATAEPSLAWAYPPVGGPGSVAWRAISAPRTAPWADQLRQALRKGDVDTDWLREQRISVLYTCLPAPKRCTVLNNSDLPQVRLGVYVVPPLQQ